jgi:predicted dehydrogenase
MDLTRRDLARLAVAGVAAQLQPALRAQDSGRKIGYCIVGLGRISMNQFMPGILKSKYSRVTAVVSGHRPKAERIAAQYRVPSKNIYNYQNYDAIADNKDIDAVYIALPNGMHAEYTIRAAKAGKHVLCEKPMCNTVAEAEQMIAACRNAKRKLMIAYRCHYESTNLKAVQLIREGQLGSIQSIESGFGFNIRPGEWRLNRKLAGGGPLMDVGIYSLNACRYLTGEEPVSVKAVSSVVDHDGRFREVEENVSWTMKFPSGAVAACNTTYGAGLVGFFRVHGSKGVLEVDPAFFYDGQYLRAQIGGEKIDELNPQKDPYQFTAEADHFAQCIEEDKEPKTPGEEGLRDMKLIARIYQSCQAGPEAHEHG